MIVLASASPRRAALLEQIGIRFSAQPVDVDETRLPDETPSEYVVRLARFKAQAVGEGPMPVLGADTAVVLDGVVFGKPDGEEDAVRMLMRLSGREHEVVTGVAVCGRRDGQWRCESVCASATVVFRPIEEAEARRYWRTGEPADKAGGYGIQGVGGIFAERIIGSYGAIVGLPLAEAEALLRSFGVDTWQFRG